jgi:NodT family efflux transporter outer membrane factor (OMF) lipoprotein
VKRLLPLPALLLALLAACTVGPDYERPSAPVSETFRETPSDWKEAQPNDAIERGKWWEMFGDAELNALVEKVEVSNQSLAASEAQFRQALAAITAARAPLFPTLDADVSVTKARSPTGVIGGLTAGRVVTQRSASVAANWEIDLWGRIRRGVEAAEASAYASSGDLASARLSLQAQLITSYFQLRLIDVQKNLLDDTVAAFRRSLELTSNRYAAGVAAKVDVVQADQQVKSTLAQAADLGVQRAQLEHAIAVLTGVAPAQLSIAPRPAYDVAMPAIPPGLPSSLLERRPDVAAAERRMAAANAQIGVAKAAYFPQLTLNAQYGFRSTDVETWFTAPSHFWSFGPALAQSLFDAGLRAAQTEQARAAYDATVATYRQTALTALQDVEDNLAALRILEEEAKLQSDALAAARLSVQLTLNQYKAGTVSFLNVVVVQAAQLNEERNAVAILNRRLAASVSLVRAIGGGWKRDY